jgi:hypothetical protein
VTALPFLALWLALVAGIALAAPPEGADPALAPWFQSLTQPGTGSSCCSIADCRPTDWKFSDGHYEIPVDDKWIAVPDELVLKRENPTGNAIACKLNGRVLCFVPPSLA